MGLSLDLVMEFQELYLKTFGVPILPEAAEAELLSLAELVRITMPPKTKEDEDE